jgi:predicted DNA-binding transcriptional regulator AlpA
MNDNLIQSKDLALMLDISPKTLERWRYQGTGPQYKKIGRRVYYALSDLEDYLEKQTFQSTAEYSATNISKRGWL